MTGSKPARNPLTDVVTGRTPDGSPRSGAYVRVFTAKTLAGEEYNGLSLSFQDEETGKRYVLFTLPGSPAARYLGDAGRDAVGLGFLGDGVKYPQFRVRVETTPEGSAAAATQAPDAKARREALIARAAAFAHRAEHAQADAEGSSDQPQF
jgi:hypothetical protein